MRSRNFTQSVIFTSLLILFYATGVDAQEKKIITKQEYENSLPGKAGAVTAEKQIIYSQPAVTLPVNQQEKKIIYSRNPEQAAGKTLQPEQSQKIIYGKDILPATTDVNSSGSTGILEYGKSPQTNVNAVENSQAPLAPAAGACMQFNGTVSSLLQPTCSYSSPGFINNASFTITVEDAEACAGTYTVHSAPVAGSGPGGSTPVITTIVTYIGFPQGNFFFGNAGPGQYEVTITNTNLACSVPKNPVILKVTIEDAPPSEECNTLPPQQFSAMVSANNSPSCAFESNSFSNNGNFTIHVDDASACAGTYTIHAEPVPNSAPDGSTPVQTTIITYIGFPAGNFFFGNAGPGQYEITVTNTNGACSPPKNPLIFTVTVADAPASEACDLLPENQFAAEATVNNSPTCAFGSPGFSNNGNFTIHITDAVACAGTYTVHAEPVANSAPDGSTPVQTTIITYIGFPAGNFFFGNAGPGQYQVTVTNTNIACSPNKNPVTFTVTIADAPPSEDCNTPLPQQFTASIKANNSPTCAYSSLGFSNNGNFTIQVNDASACAGTYTIHAEPVANSAPDGSTPVQTTIITYIGFPAGNFFFGNAGPGQYEVTVTNTNGACSPAKNPLIFTVAIADAPASEACDLLPENQFTAEETANHSPTCAYSSFGYGNNGNFTIKVTDAFACAGTYTIHAEPVPNSAPDGSTPVQTTIVTYIGFPAGNFFFGNAGAGQYEITVTNTNIACHPNKKTIKFIVTIADATPPSMNPVADLNTCPGALTGPVNFSSSTPGVTYLWTNDNPAIGLAASGTGSVPVFTATNAGNTAISGTITVKPAFENAGCYCTGEPVQFKITVADNQAPVISGISASPNTLAPPNHMMVDVTVNYTVTDAGSTTNTLSVTSNEPVSGPGSGNTAPDWIVVSPHQVQLRAERLGDGNDRVYTITITSEDACGHTSTATVPVTVPRDQSANATENTVLRAGISPNPSRTNFELTVTSTNTNDRILVRVVDLYGRLLDMSTVTPGSRMKLGAAYREGVYFVHIIQGGKVQVLKLLKISN